MIKIYLDVYFFINLCIDYIAVYSVSAVCHRSAGALRLVTASLFGALLSVALCFIDTPFDLLLLIVLSPLICKIAFSGNAVIPTLMLWCVEIFIGGGVTVISGIIHGRLVLLPVILTSAVASLLFRWAQKRLLRSVRTPTVKATVRLGEETARLTLLVDSGNLARDPVTDRRIIFLSRSALQKISIPEGLKHRTLLIKGATGIKEAKVYEADEVVFEGDECESEKFMVLPDSGCEDFAGCDGLAPLR